MGMLPERKAKFCWYNLSTPVSPLYLSDIGTAATNFFCRKHYLDPIGEDAGLSSGGMSTCRIRSASSDAESCNLIWYAIHVYTYVTQPGCPRERDAVHTSQV